MGKVYGYVRVSSTDQHEVRQLASGGISAYGGNKKK